MAAEGVKPDLVKVEAFAFLLDVAQKARLEDVRTKAAMSAKGKGPKRKKGAKDEDDKAACKALDMFKKKKTVG